MFAIYEDEHVYGGETMPGGDVYTKNEAARKEDFENWYVKYNVKERNEKKIKIMNQVNTAKTKKELEYAVHEAKQLGGGRYAAFDEDDLRRLHRKIKNADKEER